MAKPVVEVKGLRELNRALRKFDKELADSLKVEFRKIAEGHVPTVSSALPRRTGRLAGNVRAGATKRAALIRIGGARVPYAGAVIFGGYPKGRPFVREGRFGYPWVKEDQVLKEAEIAFDRVERKVWND